jgi:hypothetical protein
MRVYSGYAGYAYHGIGRRRDPCRENWVMTIGCSVAHVYVPPYYTHILAHIVSDCLIYSRMHVFQAKSVICGLNIGECVHKWSILHSHLLHCLFGISQSMNYRIVSAYFANYLASLVVGCRLGGWLWVCRNVLYARVCVCSRSDIL